MKKLNQKGFVLMETMIVSVFIMALFTLLYTELYPLIGEYERRENYDDIDSKYTAHWVRKMVLDNMKDEYTDMRVEYIDITSCSSTYFIDPSYCLQLKEAFSITKMYLSHHNIGILKNAAKDLDMSKEFKEYIAYLPYYNDPDKLDYQRVLVEINHGDYKSYGTIEVAR